MRRALVIAEFALALSLLAGGGLPLHSLWNVVHVDLGFRSDHIKKSARYRSPHASCV